MGKIVFPRRTFLKGVGGVSLGLPLMSSLACSTDQQKVYEKVASAKLADSGFPKRFIAVYTPNGSYELPTAELTGQWAALIPFKSKVNVSQGSTRACATSLPASLIKPAWRASRAAG